MNANELADYLDTFWQAKKFNEAAIMLRQQQSEIEALEARAGDYMEGWEEGFTVCKKEMNAEIEALKAKIRHIQKQTDNTPEDNHG